MSNKKVAIIVAIIVVILMICGIVLANKFSNTSSSYQTATIGQSISNDFADITLKKVVVTKTAKDETTGVNMPEEENKIYFIILGTIANKNTVAFNFSSNFETKLVFDEKYEYDITIAPSNELANIAPLEKADFVLYASVPKDVINVCENYSFKFGYNDDFSACSIEKCQNKYELTGSVNQYGSASNVTNYETFKEYISNMTSQYENLKAYDSKKTYGNNVIVKDGNALQYQKLEDGVSEFSIMPTFRFSYSDILNEKKCATDLIIEFQTQKFPDGVYYIYGNSMEISSSNGNMKIDENSTNRILDDTYKLIHQLETDFVFNSRDYDFNQLENIINGDNLTIKVMVGKSGSDDVEVTFNCNEKVKNALKQLFELNSKIEKKYE